jgi:hypothetical protein
MVNPDKGEVVALPERELTSVVGLDSSPRRREEV